MHIILLLIDLSSARKTLVSRAVHDIHQRAVRQTHSLARDLRIAFGGVLVSRANNDVQHVVYCKQANQSPFVNGGGGSGNISVTTSSGTATATKSGSTIAATPTPTSPWKLTNSYVCHNKKLTYIF